MYWGFRAWYTKLQKPMDDLLAAQLGREGDDRTVGDPPDDGLVEELEG